MITTSCYCDTYRQYCVLVDYEQTKYADTDWLSVQTIQKYVYLTKTIQKRYLISQFWNRFICKLSTDTDNSPKRIGLTRETRIVYSYDYLTQPQHLIYMKTRSSDDLTNPHDAFAGQSRSPNIVPFHMLGIVSSYAIVKCRNHEIRVRGHSRSL